jgi:RHS repeat-associated protein
VIISRTTPTPEMDRAVHRYLAAKWRKSAPVCGDGTVDPGEQCDDGNSVAGDGCSASCKLELTCTSCQSGDACCPAELGCTSANDSDCDGGNPCANASSCVGGDGCCPRGCETSPDDSDCGPNCVPVCSASGLPDGCGRICGECVATADSDGDGLFDCDEQNDGDPWTNASIFNGVHAKRGPSCHAGASCSGIDTRSEIASCFAPTEANSLASGWDFSVTSGDACNSGFGFDPAWKTCGTSFAVSAEGMIRLPTPARYCFALAGSTAEQCASLFFAGAPVGVTGSTAFCTDRDAGVYPIAWYYETTNTTQNELHLRYCSSTSGDCTPTQALPNSMLRKSSDAADLHCGPNDVCSADCPCGSGRVCDPAAPACAAGYDCRPGMGERFGLAAATPVCWPRVCDNTASSDFECGTPASLCGSCPTSCIPDCTDKSCGRNECGASCGSICGAGQAGCESDADCASGLVCGRANGARFGLAADLNVCWPGACEQITTDEPCGNASSECGLCLQCVRSCGGRECGDDGCGGSCGSCEQGSCYGPAGVCITAAPTLLPPAHPVSVATVPVGTLPGKLVVTPLGSASYSVPLEVPPGRGGIQPELALHYDSSADNGYLARGWSLEGFSTIVRCNNTIASDGYAAPPSFDPNSNEAYCLDAQRLHPYAFGNNGSSITSIFYRTEDDQFALVLADFDTTVQDEQPHFEGPRRFVVYAKDGRIFEYEPINDYITQPDEFGPAAHIQVWPLATVEDRTGVNKMRIHYRDRAAEMGGSATREYYPESVIYGPDASPITITFRYTFDPEFDEERANPLSGYARGTNLQINGLLRRIEVHVGGTRVRHYTIEYDTLSPKVATRDRLTRIFDCGGDPFVCKPPTVFDYSRSYAAGADALHTLVSVTAGTSLRTVPVDSYQAVRQVKRATYSLDMNGDGLDDVLFQSYTDSDSCALGHRHRGFWNLYVSTNNADRSTNTAEQGHNVDNNQLLVDEDQECFPLETENTYSSGAGYPVDWDNDTRQDLLELDFERTDGTPKNYTVVTWDDAAKSLKRIDTGIQRAKSFFLFAARTFLLDVDGDGSKDLFICEKASEVVSQRLYLHESGQGAAYVEAHRHDLMGALTDCPDAVPLDVDGDGREELVADGRTITFALGTFDIVVHVENGVSFPPLPYKVSTSDPIFVGSFASDVNGDGLNDIVTAEPRKGRVFLNRGDGTFDDFRFQLPADIHDLNAWDADFDGREDLVFRDGQGLRILRSTGVSFEAYTGGISFPAGARYARPVDTDGDGVPGLLYGDANLSVAERSRESIDRLVSITDGLGAKSTITYAPLTNRLVYEPRLFGSHGSTQCQFPFKCGQPRGLVVWYIAEYDGAGANAAAARIFMHEYADARYDALGHGALGFAQHSVHRQSIVDLSDLRRIDTYYDNHLLYYDDPTDLRRVAYPGALRPNRTVDTTFVEETAGGVDEIMEYVTESTTEYAVTPTTVNKAYSVLPQRITTQRHTAGNGSFEQLAQTSWTVLERDDRGNVLRSQTELGDYETILVEQDYKHRSDTSFDTKWLISLPTMRIETSTNHTTNTTKVRHTERDYDTMGQLSRTTFEPGDAAHMLITDFIRTAQQDWNVVASTQTDGLLQTRTTQIEYDDINEYPRALINAKGQRTEVGYDRVSGKIRYVYDPNQMQTDWFYDAFGRLGAVVEPDGNRVLYMLAAGSGDSPYSLEVRADGGGRTRTDFDVHGRPTQRRVWALNGKQLVQTTHYDTDGFVDRQTIPVADGVASSLDIRFDYDNLGRPLSYTAADGNVTTFCHNLRTSCVRNPRGNTSCVVRDDLNRPVLSADPVPGDCTTVLASAPLLSGINSGYGNFSDLEWTRDQAQHVALRTTDAWGRPTWMNDPDHGERTFEYDGFGQLSQVSDANGRAFDFFYDPLGREQRMEARQGDDPVQTTEWIWDGGASADPNQGELIGYLTGTTSPDNVQRTLRYEPGSGRLTTIVDQIVGEAFETSFTHDQFGRVRRIDYPRLLGNAVAVSVQYEYDGFGNVLSVGDPAAPSGAAPYWQADDTDDYGRLNAEVFGNGVVTHRVYDAVGHAQSITSVLSGAPFQDLEFNYPSGLLETKTDHVLDQTTSYQYDAFDRLIGDDSAGGATFDYDAIGNIIGNAAVQYQEAQPHALSFDGTYTYQYDAVGNRTRKERSEFVERTSYTPFDKPHEIWNEEVVGSPHDRTSFLYDASEQRVRKDAPTGITTYVGDLYERRVPEGGGATSHVYYLTDGERVIAQITMDGTASPVVTYLHPDHLGSTQMVSRLLANNTLETNRLDYDAFGLRRNPDWSGGVVPANATGVLLGFTGHEHDDDRGLINMRGRLYDPSARQFTTPDPFSTSSLNPYAYVSNQPTAYIDPTGYYGEATTPNTPVPGGVTYWEFEDHNVFANAPGPERSPLRSQAEFYDKLNQSVLSSVGTYGPTPSEIMAAGQERLNQMIATMAPASPTVTVPSVPVLAPEFYATVPAPSAPPSPPTNGMPTWNQIFQAHDFTRYEEGARTIQFVGGELPTYFWGIGSLGSLLKGGWASLKAAAAGLFSRGASTAGSEVATAVAKFNPARAGHIFRQALGHVNPASAGSQARFARLFEQVASNPANLRSDAVAAQIITQDAANAGVQAFTAVAKNGDQIWVVVRNGEIQNAGVNLAGALR